MHRSVIDAGRVPTWGPDLRSLHSLPYCRDMDATGSSRSPIMLVGYPEYDQADHERLGRALLADAVGDEARFSWALSAPRTRSQQIDAASLQIGIQGGQLWGAPGCTSRLAPYSWRNATAQTRAIWIGVGAVRTHSVEGKCSGDWHLPPVASDAPRMSSIGIPARSVTKSLADAGTPMPRYPGASRLA